MADDRLVSLRLPEPLIAALSALAQARGCAPADIVRQSLEHRLFPPARACDPAALRVLAGEAADWHDLQRRLRAAGYVLRSAAGRGLVLHAWPSDAEIGPADDFGLGPAALSLRFRAPFPGDRAQPAPAAPPEDAPARPDRTRAPARAA
jgi:hypothetical protein